MRAARPLALLLFVLVAASPGAAAAPKSDPVATASAAGDSAIYHVLKSGETLYAIARKYNVSVESIIAANDIADASKLKPGQKFLIPFVHKVLRKGETLYSIARSYDVEVDELRKLNKLSAKALIRVGDTLVVPGGKKNPVAAPIAAVPAAPTPAATVPAPSASPLPLAPDPVRTSLKAVDKKVSWPCPGEAQYLDGKAQGVMIRSKLGEPEKAVAAGKIVAAGPFRGYGQMVIVMSRTGHLYVYAGNESLSVKVGEAVRSGQELGRVGMDAKAGAPIAFFMVYRGREAVDAAEAPRD